MTFDAFWQAWQAENFENAHTVVMHFRFGTSGKMVGKNCDPGCTHPFPISDKEEDLFATDISAANIIMHNGIVGSGDGDYSDTMVSISDHVTTLLPYMKDDPKIQNLLIELLDAKDKGSRWWMAIGAESTLLGNWWKDKDTGIWYSKEGYLKDPPKPVYNHNMYNYGTTMYRSPNTNLTIIKDTVHDKFIKDSLWNWDLWDEYINNNESNEDDLKVCDDDGITEIYNVNGDVVALIDAEGETIWDDDDNDDNTTTKQNIIEAQRVRNCKDCAAQLFEMDIVDGECPYCYSILIPELVMNNNTHNSDVTCPNCGESNHLMDSTFNDTGDTECLRCGALFLDTVFGANSIVGWNKDTVAERDLLVKAVLQLSTTANGNI